MIGYGLLVGHTASLGPAGDGWQAYDRLFRSRTPVSCQWDQINTAFWQLTVNSQGSRNSQPTATVRSTGHPYRTPMGDQICFAFNDGRCINHDGSPKRADQCRRRHICRNCRAPNRAARTCGCNEAGGSRSARHDYYGNKTFSELFPFVIYDSIFDFSNISTVDSVPSVHRSILCSEREQNVAN